jgi:type I restriction enzyme S subunit
MEQIKISYKKTEVGLIPEDWDLKKFHEVTNAITCGVAATPVYVNEHIGKPFLSASHVQNQKVINGNYKFITNELYRQITKINKPEKGDILYTRVGAGIGEAGVIDFDLDFAIYVSLTLIKPKKNLDSYFIKSLLNSKHYQFLAKNGQFAGGGVQNLNVEVVREFLIPLPTLIEQQAIATALSDVDELITNLEKLIAKKKAIKQGAMQQLLTPPHKGGKRLEGFSVKWGYSNFESLCKIFTKQTGFDYSAYIKPSLVQKPENEALPFIQNKDFDNKKINFNTDYYIPKEIAIKFPKILLDEKCFLISISGSIGKVGVFQNERMAFVGGAIAIAKFKDKDLLDWVLHYLNSHEGQNKLFGNVKSGSHQNLILDDIRKIMIPIPSKEERNIITSFLDDIDDDLNLLELKRNKLENIKQGMMQELLTGKTRLI